MTRAIDDVPLICDPVPGPTAIITVPHALSPAALRRLRQEWEAASVGMPQRIMILDEGDLAERPQREWPDAEFCAA